LINLYGLMDKEITASSLVKIDVEGNTVLKQELCDPRRGSRMAGHAPAARRRRE
jgi:hypothetical protein